MIYVVTAVHDRYRITEKFVENLLKQSYKDIHLLSLIHIFPGGSHPNGIAETAALQFVFGLGDNSDHDFDL